MRLESLVSISRIKTLAIEVIAVTLTWILFYQLSLWLFSYFEYNPRAYWVFLPAGIRMISVFIFGWAGVLGLFIGSVITNDAEMSHYVVYLAAISSLSPMLAIRLCKWCYNIPVNLKGLKVNHLVGFALAGAFANASFSSLLFYNSGIPKSVDGFLPMFVGDLLGSIIILYLSHILIRLSVKLYNPPPRVNLHKKNDLLDYVT